MTTMTIDIETYSDQDIRKGVHKYVDSPSFAILLFAYAIDDGPVQVIDMAQGEDLTQDQVFCLLYDERILKTAYNANFELTCLDAWLTRRGYEPLDDKQWQCDMVLACYNGYPPGLGITAKALGLPEDKQKDTRGRQLIYYFCKPCRPSKANGGRTRNLPADAPEDWQVFKEYNAQDVVTERAIRDAIKGHMPPEREWVLWRLDRRINALGIRIDQHLAYQAIQFSEKCTAELTEEAQKLTGLANPNSPAQLKNWLRLNGHAVVSLNKDSVAELLADEKLHPSIRRVLAIRSMLGKTSIRKYEAMLTSVTEDGRAHDLFQFYGTHTGRWAGRNIQLQNLPRNYLSDLDTARAVVRDGDLATLELLYDNVPDTLSQLIRTALIPSTNCRFIVADFSAIEARVIAWVSGTKWRQEAFAQGKDIYCASASQMFGVPVEKHGINGHLRQKGKIAELALGYGGGIAALKAFGADKMGLNDVELKEIVTKWRKASPEIPQLWDSMEQAALRTIKTPFDNITHFSRYGSFLKKGRSLYLQLPGGRDVVYPNARIGRNRFGNVSMLYDGLNQTTRKFETQETYGGKLTENFVQAIARDCLAVAMLRLEKAGYPIVAHIHDEVVLDMPQDKGSLEEAIQIMTQNSWWNKGLLMNADGFEGAYYRKD